MPRVPSRAVGVGHPVNSVSRVRRTEARSAHTGSPDSISKLLHVSAYSGEPFTPILAINLLSKDRWRSALGDKRVKSGPQVSFIGMAFSVSRARKRLTGTGASPDFSVFGPSGKFECVGPASDSCEEMALRESVESARIQIGDTSFVNFSGWDVSAFDKFSEPSGGVSVVVIVEVHTK